MRHFVRILKTTPPVASNKSKKYQSYLLTAMKNDLDFSIKLERFFLEMIIWQLPAKVLQVSNFTHKKSWHPPIPPWDKENCEIFNTHFFIVCNIRIYLPQYCNNFKISLLAFFSWNHLTLDDQSSLQKLVWRNFFQNNHKRGAHLLPFTLIFRQINDQKLLF